MNPKAKKHILHGIAVVWGIVLAVAVFVGLCVLAAKLPLVGVPLLITLVGALFGLISADIDGEDLI